MASEPSAVIEHVATGVVVEDDGLVRRRAEERLLIFLRHELRPCDGDSFVFFAGAGVDEEEVAIFETLFDLCRFEKHLQIVAMAFEEGFYGVFDLDLVAGANRGQGVLIAVGAGLASADVEGRKQGSAGPRKAGEEVVHPVSGLDVGRLIHSATMAALGRISSLCAGKIVGIVTP